MTEQTMWRILDAWYLDLTRERVTYSAYNAKTRWTIQTMSSLLGLMSQESNYIPMTNEDKQLYRWFIDGVEVVDE